MHTASKGESESAAGQEDQDGYIQSKSTEALGKEANNISAAVLAEAALNVLCTLAQMLLYSGEIGGDSMAISQVFCKSKNDRDGFEISYKWDGFLYISNRTL